MPSNKQKSIQALKQIPGVGNSIANDLWNIGIKSISDLKGKNAEQLYDDLNRFTGAVHDRCVRYVFRCAVYYANTDEIQRDPEKLKWWNWKDKGR